MRTISFLLFVLCSIRVFAADDVLDAAVKRLSTVDRFAFGHVGYAGVISKGETDFKLVVSKPKPTALTAFENLYLNGTLAGRAYAFAGLKKLNQARFKEVLASLRPANEELEVMRGCIVAHETLLQVAKEIDQGEFRF